MGCRVLAFAFFAAGVGGPALAYFVLGKGLFILHLEMSKMSTFHLGVESRNGKTTGSVVYSSVLYQLKEYVSLLIDLHKDNGSVSCPNSQL